jgi:RNA polymerase sigma-70 factor (ECF subfamily)
MAQQAAGKPEEIEFARSAARAADAQCVEAVKAGQRERFGELVARYQDAVYAITLAYTHDSHRAEDLAQEVFLKAYGALAQLRSPAHFGAWLMQIARHHAARSRQQEALRPKPVPDAGLAQVGTPQQPDPHRAARILAMVEELPEPYRETARLKYQEGLTCRQIAEREGVAIGTITSRLARALVMLRTALKP